MKFYDGSGADPVVFLEENKDFAFLVIDEELAKPLLRLDGSAKLSSHASAIRKLAKSTSTGKLLFSSALKSLAMEDVSTVIDKAVEELQDGEINEARLASCLANVKSKLEDVEGIDLIPRRDLEIEYRGVQLTYQAKTPLRGAELTLRSLVRGAAASQGVLCELPGEQFVTKKSESVKIHPDLVCKAVRARAFFLTALCGRAKDTSKDAIGDELKARSL